MKNILLITADENSAFIPTLQIAEKLIQDNFHVTFAKPFPIMRMTREIGIPGMDINAEKEVYEKLNSFVNNNKNVSLVELNSINYESVLKNNEISYVLFLTYLHHPDLENYTMDKKVIGYYKDYVYPLFDLLKNKSSIDGLGTFFYLECTKEVQMVRDLFQKKLPNTKIDYFCIDPKVIQDKISSNNTYSSSFWSEFNANAYTEYKKLENDNFVNYVGYPYNIETHESKLDKFFSNSPQNKHMLVSSGSRDIKEFLELLCLILKKYQMENIQFVVTADNSDNRYDETIQGFESFFSFSGFISFRDKAISKFDGALIAGGSGTCQLLASNGVPFISNPVVIPEFDHEKYPQSKLHHYACYLYSKAYEKLGSCILIQKGYENNEYFSNSLDKKYGFEKGAITDKNALADITKDAIDLLLKSGDKKRKAKEIKGDYSMNGVKNVVNVIKQRLETQ